MTNEFKVGQVVYGDDFTYLPVGSKIQSLAAFPAHFTKVAPGNAWAYTDAAGNTDSPASLDAAGPGRTLIYLPEPEDADLYVEPEPLKEGDWVQVWAQVADPNFSGEVEVELWRIDDSAERVLTRTDAIVRPDAGQVPPWVKPTRCTSLLAVEDGERLLRCARDEHGAEVYHWNDAVETWADAEAYGRVEVSS